MDNRVYCGIALTSMLLLVADLVCCAQSKPASSNPWTVTAIRERRAGETPLEESNVYLRAPDSNYVPGPDSLVARVTIIERKGYVEVLDLRTGVAQRLLTRYASLPQWSPDGRYISCIAWKSTRQPYELTIVEVASRTIVTDPDVRASGTKPKWSPDSRTVAASGVIYATPRCMLYTVSVPDGNVSILDSLGVLVDYDFSWSPDGRWLAYTRPTALDRMGEYALAADLWIADAETGKSWPLVEGHEWVESNPLWITARSIQVNRSAREGDELGADQVVVVEIATSKGKSSKPSN